MVPILFEPNTTNFSTNGVGRLSDAVSCVVREEKNGLFELEMVYPVGGIHFDSIVDSAIIYAKPSARRNPQAFRIYKITKPMNGEIAVYAEHISYQMSFIPVSPFSAASLSDALSAMASGAAETCPFTLSADFVDASSFAFPLPTSMRSLLGGEGLSILSVYGGEWEFDNYSATLHENRGEDNGMLIMYGKNLVNLEQEANIAEVCTGVFPYWQSEQTLVTLAEKVVHSELAPYYPYNRTVVHDFSSDFENVPTDTQLRNAAEAYLQTPGIGLPVVSLSLEWVNLKDTIEYRDMLTGDVDLCDMVTVRFEKLGINLKAQVIAIEYDTLNERYNSFEVGDRKQTLARTIENQMEHIEAAPTTDEMHNSIDRATGILAEGTRGHVIINRNPSGFANEILFLDTDNISTAMHVLRINMNGIGFSSNGYQGPYFNSWTLDGHLALGGSNNGYGILQLLNGSGTVIGHFSATDGLEFSRGQNIGFKADGNSILLGDFEVNDAYGRQILESSDEKTGMSGEPNQQGGLYLWAGYTDANNYAFLVNNSGQTRVQGELWVAGEDSDGTYHNYNIVDEIARIKEELENIDVGG